MMEALRHTDLVRPRLIKTPRPFVRPVPIPNPGPGCVLYLAWDSPGAGGTWVDRSGKGNHGTINGATWVDTPWGRGLSFDGVDDYVDCGNDSSLDFGTGSFSVEMWLKTGDYSITNARVLDKGGTSEAGYEIFGSKTAMAFSVHNGSARTIVPFENFTQGVWTHIVGLRSGDTIKTFLNGNYSGNSGALTGTTSNNTYDLAIGKDIKNSGLWFLGSIALVRIYNRALSPAEIAQHYWEENPYA